MQLLERNRQQLTSLLHRSESNRMSNFVEFGVLCRLFDKTPHDLRKSAYWNSLVHFMKFFAHFCFVMLLMFCGAIVFALLENPEVFSLEKLSEDRGSNTSEPATNATTSKDAHHRNVSHFWEAVESKYDVKVSHHLREEVSAFWGKQGENENEIREILTKKRERKFIIKKWFYFITISMTTIGYGHVHPETDNGKLFYIFFSIIGISMMMSLLKSMGAILNATNKKVYTAIAKYLFKDKRVVSVELMSVISITLMFLVFMLLVIWHDGAIVESEHWKLIDTVYYWIVTFTTVGFGDVHFSLEEEINHICEMLFYRMFGLAFLAGIIDAIQMYIKYRRKMLQSKSRRSLTQIKLLLENRARKSLETDDTA